MLWSAEWRDHRMHMIHKEASRRGLRGGTLAKQWSCWSRVKMREREGAVSAWTNYPPLIEMRETKGLWEMSPTQESHGETPRHHKDGLFVPANRKCDVSSADAWWEKKTKITIDVSYQVVLNVTFASWSVRAVSLYRRAGPALTQKTEKKRKKLGYCIYKSYCICIRHIHWTVIMTAFHRFKKFSELLIYNFLNGLCSPLLRDFWLW